MAKGRTGAAPGVSRSTKHQNFGWGRPRNAKHPGMHAVQCNEGASQAYARNWMSYPASKKTMTRRQANQLHGPRAGG